MRRTFSILILTVCTAMAVFAQNRVSDYSINTPILPWTDLSQSGTATYISDEIFYYTSATTALPFDFPFDGTIIPSGHALFIGPGSFSFHAVPPYGSLNAGLGNPSYPGNIIFWGGPYVNAGSGQFNGIHDYGVYTETDGVAPNRIFTIQWTDVHTDFLSGVAFQNSIYLCSMQVKLFESSGEIQFLYKNHQQFLGGFYSEGIGLNGFNSPSFASIAYSTAISSTPATDIDFKPCNATTITSQPSDITVCTGQTVELSVGATGSGITYQWRENGSSIPGARSSSYTINSATTANSGSYDVIVMSACAAPVTSNAATVTVNSPPTISVSLSPTTLWPANNQLKTINATVTTSGECTPLSVELLSVTANELINSNDISATTGSDSRSFEVRASRNGSGAGRIYTATYKVTDAAGNSDTTSATVTVPHDQGGNKLPDGNSAMDSLGENLPLSLAVFPDPVRNTATIRIATVIAGLPTTVDIVNAEGNKVASLYEGIPSNESGLVLTIDCSKLANGIYYVHVQNSVMGSATKFVVLK